MGLEETDVRLLIASSTLPLRLATHNPKAAIRRLSMPAAPAHATRLLQLQSQLTVPNDMIKPGYWD